MKTMEEANYGTKITARFEPKRRDDLRPEMLPFIGKTLTWHWSGPMEQGQYAGQDIWHCWDEEGPRRWVPDEDLEPT